MNNPTTVSLASITLNINTIQTLSVIGYIVFSIYRRFSPNEYLFFLALFLFCFNLLVSMLIFIKNRKNKLPNTFTHYMVIFVNLASILFAALYIKGF